MAIDVNDIIEGLDPSVLSTISGSQLLNMVRNATPSNSRGFLIKDNATPDTTTYPRFKRYGWIRPSDNPPIFRVWNDATNAWVAVSLYIGSSTITNAMLIDNSIDKVKLKAEAANKILRMNSAGTLWVVQDFVPDSASITLAMFALLSAGNGGKFLRFKIAENGWEVVSPDDIANAFSNAAINFTKIYAGGVNGASLPKFIKVASGGSNWELSFIEVGAINSSGIPDDYVLKSRTGAAQWLPLLPEAVYGEIQPNNTVPAGQPFNNGARRTRILNTEISDVSGLGSLASNQVTLTAGTWNVEAIASAEGVGAHQLFVRNITDAADVASGLTHKAVAGSNIDYAQCFGRFTISISKVFELQHICQTSQATGFGTPANLGNNEMYARVKFTKVA